MPRLENTGDAVSAWSEKSGEGSSTFDLCQDCAEEHEGTTLAEAGLKPYHTGEPSGTLEGEVDHPSYSDDSYVCACCEADLTADDN